MAELKQNLKYKYKRQLSSLAVIINEWDPFCLIDNGAPKDEFDQEVAQILSKLKSNSQLEDTLAKLTSS